MATFKKRKENKTYVSPQSQMEFYDLVERVVRRSPIGDHRLKRATENAFVERNMWLRIPSEL
jgi:hypothetical protein